MVIHRAAIRLVVVAIAVVSLPCTAVAASKKPTVLWANVRSDGALVRGTAIGASSLGTGTGAYTVTFDQDVSNCAAVATSGGFPGFDFAATNATADTDTSTVVPNQVFLTFIRADSVAHVDTAFHLVVVCD